MTLTRQLKIRSIARRFVSHTGEYITISVQGNGYVGMSEYFLDNLDVDTLAQHQGSAGVA